MDMETFIKACSRIVLLTREVHLYCKLSDEQLKFTVGLQKKCNNLWIHDRGGGRVWSYFRGKSLSEYLK